MHPESHVCCQQTLLIDSSQIPASKKQWLSQFPVKAVLPGSSCHRLWFSFSVFYVEIYALASDLTVSHLVVDSGIRYTRDFKGKERKTLCHAVIVVQDKTMSFRKTLCSLDSLEVHEAELQQLPIFMQDVLSTSHVFLQNSLFGVVVENVDFSLFYCHPWLYSRMNHRKKDRDRRRRALTIFTIWHKKFYLVCFLSFGSFLFLTAFWVHFEAEQKKAISQCPSNQLTLPFLTLNLSIYLWKRDTKCPAVVTLVVEVSLF